MQIIKLLSFTIIPKNDKIQVNKEVYMLKKIFRKLNIKESDYLVIGCSAGPDSMALLHYIQNNTRSKFIFISNYSLPP